MNLSLKLHLDLMSLSKPFICVYHMLIDVKRNQLDVGDSCTHTTLTETLMARRMTTYLRLAEDPFGVLLGLRHRVPVHEALWTLACHVIYLFSLTLGENKKEGEM